METPESDQYVTYTLSEVHDMQQSIISHEEICEPSDTVVLPQEAQILCERSSSDDENSVVYPIYIKQEETPQYTSGDDESMAVEALRQLGGMYPTFIEKKPANIGTLSQLKHDEVENSRTSEFREPHAEFGANCDETNSTTRQHDGTVQFRSETTEFHDGSVEFHEGIPVGGVQNFDEKSFGDSGSGGTSEKNAELPENSAPRKNFGKFSCSTCSEKFERKQDLNNHVVCHQVDRPHACRTCGNLFRSKSSLQSHMSQVHNQEKPHKCSICGADFQRPSSLSNHMKIHTYVAGRALISQSDNFAESSQNSSQVQSYEVTQIANWQSYTFQGDQNAIGGEKIDLQEFAVLPNGEVAQFEYPQTYNLSLNNFTGTETLVKVEGLPFDQRRPQFVTVELEKSQFTCAHCGVSFSRATALASHEKIHNAKSWAMPIECEYCDKQFQDSHHLASHQTTCAKKLMLNNSENSNGKWSKHACAECGKKFTTKQKMFRHQWIHRKKTHSCEVCGTQFEKQNQLDEHRLSAHPGDSPFTCSECGKSFVSRQGLWEHGRTHAGSPAHFHCDTCSKTFSSRQGYLIHHRTHTGERPYGCKFCWKAFRDGGTLRKHERIHTGERPHVCPLCSRAFNQKVVLREHVRWVHAAGKNETEVVGPPFPCPLCGAMNQDRDELCAHIVKHSDQMIAEAKAKSSNSAVKSKAAKKKGRGRRAAKEPAVGEGETLLLVATDRNEVKNEVVVEDIKELRVHFVDSKESTLQIISKENEELPVLAIPNDGDEFAGEIERIEETVYQESDDEREMELICGICGDEFGDKNILMEHVKVHI